MPNCAAVVFVIILFILTISIEGDYGPRWYTCDSSTCDYGCVCASIHPPGGLPPSKTPQFILLTHDDIVHPDSTSNIDFLTKGIKNQNKCRIPCTYFVMTGGSADYPHSDAVEVRNRWQLGDEIGAHARNHINQIDPSTTLSEREDEIVGCKNWIVDVAGIPARHVTGYRTPFLAESTEQRQILETNRFLYDSSIVETTKNETLKSQRVWPYRMDAGIPQRRHYIKKGTERNEIHKGLWEIPVWVLLHQENKYTMDPGRGVEGNGKEEDVYDVLRSNFDASYNGNRAPLPMYIHAFWFDGVREVRARQFIEYALSKPHVYFVTMQTLIAWMENPVPVEVMDDWLSHRCTPRRRDTAHRSFLKDVDIACPSISDIFCNIYAGYVSMYRMPNGWEIMVATAGVCSVIVMLLVLEGRKKTVPKLVP